MFWGQCQKISKSSSSDTVWEEWNISNIFYVANISCTFLYLSLNKDGKLYLPIIGSDKIMIDNKTDTIIKELKIKTHFTFFHWKLFLLRFLGCSFENFISKMLKNKTEKRLSRKYF